MLGCVGKLFGTGESFVKVKVLSEYNISEIHWFIIVVEKDC